MVWYPLEWQKSLRSGFAPFPQQQTINMAVLDFLYYQAHKISLTNQGSYLCRGWILHKIRWTVPSVSCQCKVRKVICRCQIQNTRAVYTVYRNPSSSPIHPWQCMYTVVSVLNMDIHAPGGIRPHKLSGRAAADLRLRPPGHWDRTFRKVTRLIFHHILRDDLN
jgi:hypothetical protein